MTQIDYHLDQSSLLLLLSADSQPDSGHPGWLPPFTTHFLNCSVLPHLDLCVRVVHLGGLLPFVSQRRCLGMVSFVLSFAFSIQVQSHLNQHLFPYPLWRVYFKNFVLHLDSLITVHITSLDTLTSTVIYLKIFINYIYSWCCILCGFQKYIVMNSPLQYCME